MKEAFLHYLFDQRKLGNDFVTTMGEALRVKRFGELNKNAGPDFQNSQIILDNKIWAGHIEFHIKSSDWMKHKHQFDPAYNNVIAHFVYEHDLEIKSGAYLLPVVELKRLIDSEEEVKYEKLISSKGWISCQNQIADLPSSLIQETIEEKGLDRVQRKVDQINKLKTSLKGDDQKVLNLLLAKYLGGKVNQLPFERLMSMVEPTMLANLNFENYRITSFLLGLSGLLPEKSDNEYVLKLKNEYKYISKLFSLSQMSIEEWKFSSLRPSGSPVIRIAQLAAILSKQESYSNFMNDAVLKLSDLELDEFWSNHYNFEKETKTKSCQIGASAVNSILINVITPIRLAKDLDFQPDEALNPRLDLLRDLKTEKNNLISNWKKVGINPKNAFESQALIELKNEHCSRKKCLFCGLGKAILSK